MKLTEKEREELSKYLEDNGIFILCGIILDGDKKEATRLTKKWYEEKLKKLKRKNDVSG